MHSVRVSWKGAKRAASGHPWIFSSDVVDTGEAKGGDAVAVVDPKGQQLGVAHFSSASQISLRLLSPKTEPVDLEFFRRRLLAARQFRAQVVRDTNAYRLVHAEADGLPGLIVDVYGGCIVLQTLTQGMAKAQPEIVQCLEDILEPAAIVARNDAAVRSRESLPREKSVLAGALPAAAVVKLNGFEWCVDPLGGQKTGIYLDQRENYLGAARYASGEALDCFTSTGGFALHLARACRQVEAVDSSESALATAAANAQRNEITNIAWKQADVFDLLSSYSKARRRFDIVVLDPPAFTKSRGAIEGAARGYKEINLRGLRLLGPGGVLVTCSCSHHFTEAMLLETVAAAALDAGRTLRVLERRTQAQDHPILLTVPETLYLKCLILQVI